MISLEQINKIVLLQKTTNDIAKPDWLDNPPNYLRAAKMETVEAIDHLCSWKWWKANNPDYYNAAMEMVDALHFIISEELVRFKGDVDAVSALLLSYFNMPIDEEQVAAMSAEDANQIMDAMDVDFTTGNIHYPRFFTASAFLGLKPEQLLSWYCGKNALNNFRQANGYKTGEYVKNWFGNEDNDYLIEIIEALSTDEQQDSYHVIYERLGIKYKEALAQV
ncbi:dUTP diphosphatase [Ningiella sp. W23]|uniref:dUTP diphosphatase n=1 Tax=Ningiella sp. W23 TaxID=3023715 RepID=UPI003757E3EF